MDFIDAPDPRWYGGRASEAMARTKEEMYAAWAPEGARWSPWVKPVLFATYDPGAMAVPSIPGIDVSWAPAASRTVAEAEGASGYRQPDEPGPSAPGETAIVLELPGRASLEMGLALARVGYRPVPVISATPSPWAATALVDVRSMQLVLSAGADVLGALSLPPDAPPVFVLDAQRMSERPALPGQYDNRSLVFPQDFPSATHLREAGVTSVLLVTQASTVRDDLAHVLVRYRSAGLRVEVQPPGAGPRRPLERDEPSGIRTMMYRAFALLGLRRNAAGGFGALVPEPSSGGGG